MSIKTVFPAAALHLALGGLLACASAQADENVIYKQIKPDGTVFYTDKPNSKARTEKQLKMVVPISNPIVSSSGSNAAGPAFSVGLPVPGTVISVPNLPPLPGSFSSAAPLPTSTSRAASDQGVHDKTNLEQVKEKKAAAQTNYDAAVAAQQAGQHAIAGERNKNKNGTFRMNENYTKRQAELETNVKQAEQELKASK